VSYLDSLWTGWQPLTPSLRARDARSSRAAVASRAFDCGFARSGRECPYAREQFDCRDCLLEEATGGVAPRT